MRRCSQRNLFEAAFAQRASVTSDRRIAALEQYEIDAGDRPTVERALPDYSEERIARFMAAGFMTLKSHS